MKHISWLVHTPGQLMFPCASAIFERQQRRGAFRGVCVCGKCCFGHGITRRNGQGIQAAVLESPDEPLMLSCLTGSLQLITSLQLSRLILQVHRRLSCRPSYYKQSFVNQEIVPRSVETASSRSGRYHYPFERIYLNVWYPRREWQMKTRRSVHIVI